jgi:hypothetical protein
MNQTAGLQNDAHMQAHLRPSELAALERQNRQQCIAHAAQILVPEFG